MPSIDQPIAKRIAALFRMLGSDYEGERANAIIAMRKLLATEGIGFNDLAVLIENHTGEIEELKYSDADVATIYQKGVEKGQAQAHESGNGVFGADGSPQWDKIALWCQERSARLRPNEQQFIDDMAGRTQFREPTEKQAKWLISIFLKLGGKREATII
jgi:hypothetical protein